MTTAIIHGLVLAGGLSSRMRHDKAALAYGGRSQLDRAYELAGRHAAKVFVSVRADQALDPARARYPMIVDTAAGEGPIVGIRSAFEALPHAAWLVLACDLPFVSDAVIDELLANRDSSVLATAYRSTHDGLPEPLCAIWEPSAAAALAAFHAKGKDCPRKFLLRHPARILEPIDARALDNVNTPEEYARALTALDTVNPCN